MINKTLETKTQLYANSIAVLDGMADMIVETLSEEVYFDGRIYPKVVLDTLGSQLQLLNDMSIFIDESWDTLSYSDINKIYDERQELMNGLINEFSRFV
jgi:hypothetical protein